MQSSTHPAPGKKHSLIFRDSISLHNSNIFQSLTPKRNLRLKDLTGLELRNIREVYGKICKFVTGSKLNLNSPLKPMNFGSQKNSSKALLLSKKNNKNSANKMAGFAAATNFKKLSTNVKVMGEKRFGQEQSVNILSSRKNILASRRKISSNVNAIKRVDIENKPV